MIIIATLLSVTLISLLSLVGVFALSLQEKRLRKVLFVLVSLSAGAFFGDAIIHLIPESFAALGNPTFAGVIILAGIFLFFVTEKFLHWRHDHGGAEQELLMGVDPRHTHTQPLGPLVLFSDGLHNFIDGLIIGASYLVSIEVGIATTIAVALHEIPQEIGDFGILLHAGYSKKRALFLNFLSAVTSVFGALVALVIGQSVEGFVGILLALAAGVFIYIAGADLIPEIHRIRDPKKSFLQFVALFAGAALMFLLLFIEVDGVHDHGHDGYDTYDTVHEDEHAHAEEDHHDEDEDHADALDASSSSDAHNSTHDDDDHADTEHIDADHDRE